VKVLMISPGYPADMPLFTRGLARLGAEVIGVGDQPRGALAPEVAEALSAYLPVKQLWEEETTVEEVAGWLARHRVSVDRVECLWEPGVVLAARLREKLEVPGLSVEKAIAFRDKETMKATLDAAGIRTPHHYRAKTEGDVREGVERIGYPAIVKPIAGAGSADTHVMRGPEDLDRALAMVKHVPEVSVEEFIEGEEHTFDTICGGGRVLYRNVTWYRPNPLQIRLNPWISPIATCVRDIEVPAIAGGVELGHRVLDALGFESGFAHMEWFRTHSGEFVFGEIGARSPGGRLTHGMNLSCDIDVFTGWAEAVCVGRLSQDTSKKYNACIVFKRARGEGQRIARIEGFESILAEWGEHIPVIEMVPVGAPRRDPTREVTGDGWIVCRHYDLETAMHIAGRLATEVRVIAG
jgi:hypothetical protein